MKKACSRCGKIHDRGYICEHGVVETTREQKQADAFRNRSVWRKKSIEIRERDLYLCQVCVRNLYNTRRQYNNENVSVHHIVPLSADYERRLDNDNLITLCGYHHELAENGRIPAAVLLRIVEEQERE